MVVGDLHGNLPAFKKVLDARGPRPQSRAAPRPAGADPRAADVPGRRRDRSHQLLDVVAALKCQYPERVHLILGNHELSELTGRIIGKDGETLNAQVPHGDHDGLRRTPPTRSMTRTRASSPRCRWRSARANRVFVCHTLPDADDLDTLDLDLLEGRHLAARGA